LPPFWKPGAVERTRDPPALGDHEVRAALVALEAGRGRDYLPAR
jgi:hypothetical protein